MGNIGPLISPHPTLKVTFLNNNSPLKVKMSKSDYLPIYHISIFVPMLELLGPSTQNFKNFEKNVVHMSAKWSVAIFYLYFLFSYFLDFPKTVDIPVRHHKI